MDLINTVSGLTFLEAEANAVRGPFGTTSANYVGRQDLVKNKRASNRPRDKADLADLGELPS